MVLENMMTKMMEQIGTVVSQVDKLAKARTAEGASEQQPKVARTTEK